MRIDYQTIHEDDEAGDGCIHFEMGGYIYMIGEMDGDLIYIQRQLIDDYDNNCDNWEEPKWVDAGKTDFKFLNK
jgi:hypothetical protein